MVIFHSYVSLPEGRWSQSWLVEKRWLAHIASGFGKNGGMNPHFFWPGKIRENDDKPSRLGPLYSDKTHMKIHETCWNLETTNRIDWVSFLQICQLAASKWLYQCWINAHDERPTINLDMFSSFGLIKKLYDKLQYEVVYNIYIKPELAVSHFSCSGTIPKVTTSAPKGQKVCQQGRYHHHRGSRPASLLSVLFPGCGRFSSRSDSNCISYYILF